MAINQNHTFEDLDGVKCAIVEKCVSAGRSEFLKDLLEYNGYSVVIVPSPPPKTVAKPVPAESNETETDTAKVETFTIGVSDVTFNPVNAIYGRLLHTSDRHVVTPAYWQQKDAISHDEIPYFQKKK